MSVIPASRSWSENPVTGSSPDWATEKFLASVGYRVVTCLKTLDKCQPIEYGHHQDISCHQDMALGLHTLLLYTAARALTGLQEVLKMARS